MPFTDVGSTLLCCDGVGSISGTEKWFSGFFSMCRANLKPCVSGPGFPGFLLAMLRSVILMGAAIIGVSVLHLWLQSVASPVVALDLPIIMGFTQGHVAIFVDGPT